jgi:ubiquinone biosynthesis monooxygenase Coq7
MLFLYRKMSVAGGVVSRARGRAIREMRDRMIRVDHAGEYGANRIYAGQMAVLGNL